MFKVVALIFIITSSGEQPTDFVFRSRMAFPTESDCKAALDSGQLDRAKAELLKILERASEKSGDNLTAHFACQQQVDDGSI